ncbi:MAG: MmcB family DNA repair protein [Pseudomonadota bacterium]
MDQDLAPGFALARGVWRHFEELDLCAVPEFVPQRGLRVDLIALTKSGEIWIVECKSCRADYAADSKWQHYMDWCDRYFWAVDTEFPTEILPLETGLIIADRYDAQIVREAPQHPLPAARRTALTLRLARAAARRLLHATEGVLPQ